MQIPSQKLVVTLDGPAGSGKGTIARHLAERFGLAYLDTGLLYRFLAYQILQEKIPLNAEEKVIQQAEKITDVDVLKLTFDFPEKNLLKDESVAGIASQLAIIPQVRVILTQLQRDFIKKTAEPYKGVLLDGRDVGTVVCPEASCKLFITADSSVRANRRMLQENKGAGIQESEKMHQAILKRDQRDSVRKTAPLAAAPEA